MSSSGAVGPRLAGWPWRWPGWGVDVAIALVIAAVQIVPTTFAGHRQPEAEPLDALGYLLIALGPAALLARRRAPVAVLTVSFSAIAVYFLFGYPGGPIFFALIVSYFTVVLAGHRALAWLFIAVGYGVMVLVVPLVRGEGPPSLLAAVGLAAWLLVLATAAEVLRARRERAAAAERSRAEEERRRASEERMRIARELHDVLAHNISLINVQAGVALHLMDERPEQARTALAAIKDASKEALGELRSVLGVLRQVDEAAPRTPESGLAHIDRVVSRAAAAGLTVKTEVQGRSRPLPAEVDLAAFRIVQEALTNVTRHSGSATATVRMTYGDRDLIVRVDDDGRGMPERRTAGTGSGIRGMRERATALGGDLEAGPRPGGGFQVLARLPLDGTR